MSAESVNILLTKLMTDRFCHAEKRDLNACLAYYVPAHADNSYVDQSIQRRGAAKCEDHSKAFQMCLADDKRQNAIMAKASKHPKCPEERNTLIKCQQASGQNNASACEPQFYTLLECGMVNMIQSMQAKQQQQTQQQNHDHQPI